MSIKVARIPVSSGPKGVPGFVAWVRAAHPTIYRQLAMRLRGAQLNGLGLVGPSLATAADPVAVAAAQPSMAQTILSTVKDLVSVGLPLYQQNKIFDLQLKRAQAGLAPLDSSALADISSVRVGVDAATRNTGLMIAGGAVLAFLGAKALGLLGRR
jgi:hypothetical protein